MIDRTLIGRKLEPRTAEVERGLLRLFLESIGETNAIYLDDAAARAKGYRAAIIPPTYLLSLKIGVLHPADALTLLGVEADLGHTFHAEQSFTYFLPVCVGDRISFTETIGDVYDKKAGALTFVATDMVATNQFGETVATARLTTVITR